MKKRAADSDARRGAYLVTTRDPTARRVASLFVQRPEQYTDEQVEYLGRLGQSDATIATAYRLKQDFLRMARERHGERLNA